MATQLRSLLPHMSDVLWLACVGITDAHAHHWLDVAGYSTLALELRDQVQTMFLPPSADLDYAAGGASSSSAYHMLTSAIYAEDLDASLLQRPPPSRDTDPLDHPVCTRIALSEHGRILAKPNFRFFLLHHQSLWDAMVYSEFVAMKLQLSMARGMHHLRELLALMGFPLEDCQQPYSYMNPPLKRRLAAQLETYAPQYGLDHMTFTSFFRITGYQLLLSATDMSYAVAVLLENVVNFLEGKNDVRL